MATKKKQAAKRHVVKVTFDARKLKPVSLQAALAEGFDEWMRRYIADPKAFMAEFQAVAQFTTKSRINGASYGEGQAAYLLKLVAELALKRAKRAVRTRTVRK